MLGCSFKKNKSPLGVFTVLIWCCKHELELEGKALQEEKGRQPLDSAL